MRGRARDPGPPVRVLDHREHVGSCPGQGDRFDEVAREKCVYLPTQEIRPGARRPLGCRWDTGFRQDFPDRGRGYLHPQNEQLAVQAPIPPVGILPGQA
jgi:hypothetical protein